MSSVWAKSAIAVASAALLSMAVLPAFAQGERTEAPPAESLELPSTDVKQSKPKYTNETPNELRLGQRAAPPKKCRSGAGTKAEAEEECATQLNCPAGTAVNCQYRQNHSDWICSCK